MKMKFLVLFPVLFSCNAITSASLFNWTPRFGPPKDLLCSQTCRNDDEMERCCSCNSVSKFRPNQNSDETELEYIDIRGKGKIIDTFCEQTRNQHLCSLGTVNGHQGNHSSSNVINTLTHTYGYLRFMPVNSCLVRPLINLNLANNLIMDIGNLSCYTKLETLNLKGNKISYVTNDTFIGLSNLRTLDLSDNVIQYIDPNTFADKTVDIFLINVAHNRMKTLDISNVVLQKTFCHLDFTASLFGEVTNLLHMKLEKNKKYGSGNVTFTNTSMLEHPFKSLLHEDCSLFETVDIISKQGFGLWTFDGVSIKCDCTVGRLLKIGINMLETFYHKSHTVGVTCNYPDRLKGRNLVDIAKNEDLLNEMTCSDKPCHPSCTCLENPHTKRLIVNCTNAKLTSIPKFMPKSCFKIDLLLNNNFIKTLQHRDFFSNVSFIDLSNNKLTKIESSALTQLANVVGIKLNNNTLSQLPRNIQKFHPDIIETGDDVMSCDCENLWIGEWRRTHKAKNALFCKLKDRTDLILAENVFASDIGCVTDKPFKYLSVGLGILLCLMSPIILLSFFCRGELFILTRKIRIRKLAPNFQFDLYLSFDENDNEILNFVMSKLNPILIKNGYKIFIPCRDLPFGSPREQETINMIKSSRTVLIILSDNYGNDEDGWTRTECKKAFNLYLKNRSYNIVVIKFECNKYIKSTSTLLSAFLRLGKHINVTNRYISLYKEVVKKIGLPNQEQTRDGIQERITVLKSISDIEEEGFENEENDIVHSSNTDAKSENFEFEVEEQNIVRGANASNENERHLFDQVYWPEINIPEINSRPNSNTSFVSNVHSNLSDTSRIEELTLIDC